MVLLFDIGNTNMVIGVLKDSKVYEIGRVSSDYKKTEDEYLVLISTILDLNDIKKGNIKDAIISSVVPAITVNLKRALLKLTGKQPLVVGPGVKTGLNIKIDNSQALGSDLVVDAVAAVTFYKAPLIVIDMGTATTLSIVDKDSIYQGGLIVPGVNLSLEALGNGTAKLPKISFEEVDHVIGKNTVHCMQSGILNGTASMLDGLIDRINDELGYKCNVVMTGGLAKPIAKYMKQEHLIDSLLLLKGLMIIYNKNQA